MPEELFELIILIGLSIVVAIIFLIPIIIWRLIRGKTIYHGARKLDSPTVLYVGIIFFVVSDFWHLQQGNHTMDRYSYYLWYYLSLD